MARKSRSRDSEHFRSDGTPKTPLRSYRQAEKYMKAQDKRLRSGRGMMAYPCSVCGFLHVGRARRRRGNGGGRAS